VCLIFLTVNNTENREGPTGLLCGGEILNRNSWIATEPSKLCGVGNYLQKLTHRRTRNFPLVWNVYDDASVHNLPLLDPSPEPAEFRQQLHTKISSIQIYIASSETYKNNFCMVFSFESLSRVHELLEYLGSNWLHIHRNKIVTSVSLAVYWIVLRGKRGMFLWKCM
jgi:hypothetical protein